MYLNLAIRDLFCTLSNGDLVECFEGGLRKNNTVLALSSLEELMRRENTEAVGLTLSYAIKQGYLKPETDFFLAIANSLSGYGRQSKEIKDAAKHMRHAVIYAVPPRANNTADLELKRALAALAPQEDNGWEREEEQYG